MIDRRTSSPRRRNSDRRKGDRRQAARENLPAPIRFLREHNGKTVVLSGQLIDASPTGIRILLDSALEQKEKILVEVRGEENACFNLTGEVVWVEHQPDRRCLVGCDLRVNLTNRQFARLKSLATRQATQLNGVQ